MRKGGERHAAVTRLPYSFSKRSHVGNLRQIRKQGKGRSSKRKENRRLSFLFAPARRAPRRSRRPQTANPPLRFSGKLPARKGRTRLRQFECPAQSVQKRSRPVKANPPAAVRVPRWVGAEKEPPRQGEHACGSSRTPLGRCRKSGKSRKNFPCRKGSKTPILTLRKRLSEGYS